MILFVTVLVVSCSDSSTNGTDDPPPLIPDLDGFFVYGSNTIAADIMEPNARMARAALDPTQGSGVENMPGVYGKYLYIGANSTIQFSMVDDEVRTDYGAEGGGTVDHGDDVPNVLVDANVTHGVLLEDGPPINVSEEGLYYLFINTHEDLFVLVKTDVHMIGDATEGQWSTPTQIPLESVSESGAVFEVTNLPLSGHSGYRYMLQKGWHVYASPDIVTASSLGVESYGEAWDTGESDIGFYIDNIPHHETGMFTVRVEYNASLNEWSETKTRTGDTQIDYSETEMGLFGNAYVVNGTEADWDEGYGLHQPEISGTIYTWTWSSVDLIEERAFIFLEDGEWGGLQIDYSGADVQGTAIDDELIVDETSVGGEYHNFYVSTGGTYDITLTIDSDGDDKTVTINSVD